jgi:L-iditol 2-dehydrogenase
MMAAVLTAPNVLELQEVETPKPGPADVLIRVEACAVCGSDISLIAKPWPSQPPYGRFIPGHEYAGTVAGLGETVDEFEIGERVAVEAHLGCMRCRNCRLGHYTGCLNYGKKGHRANGFTTNGGYAQYVVNHINTVYPIPDSVDFNEAALITNLGCVLYGFETIGGYIVGDQVLVGTRASRLRVGEALGADRIIDIHQEDPVQVIKEETKGIGADLVIESSGGAQAPQMAMDMAKRMGKILLLGFPEGPVSTDFSMLGKDNKSIHTVRGEGRANCGRAVSLLASKKVNLKRLVTHSFSLNDISEAFNTFKERIGGAIKVVVKP